MARSNHLRQPYDQLDKLNSTVEGIMKCGISMAEDMQEEEQKYSNHVDEIEQYLLEFAKLSDDVNLRKAAMDKVQQVNSDVQEDEEPPELSKVFLACLSELQLSQKTSYDPSSHPIVKDFMDQVRGTNMNSDDEEETREGDVESDLVVGQVDKSLKCPLTKVFYEDPVTSTACKHSYSKSAIIAHIRQSHRPVAKCPVCGAALNESDLVPDKKLEKLVRKAKKQKSKNPSPRKVVKL